ncbi:MAG TPA: hypothetical protein VIO35_10665 [Chloroflexota bacterium]
MVDKVRLAALPGRRTLLERFILDVAPAGAERAALPKGVETVEEITTPAGARVLIAAG